MIPIFEALFILVLDDEGYIVESAEKNLESALAGAVLAELVFQQRIELKDDRVVAVNQLPTECPILDTALSNILDAARSRKLRHWLNALSDKKLLEEIGQFLVEERVLVRKKKRLYLATLDGRDSVKSRLKSRLQEIILDNQEPDLREKTLLAFLEYADLFKLIFSHRERKIAQKRIQKLIADDEARNDLDMSLNEIVSAACELER